MSTVRIQVRRGTASQWTSVNPILAAGEMGVESDTNLFKFGNGSSTWTALAYANNSDVAIGEISQDAINTALSMGAGLTKSYNDGTNTIQITVDSTVVALKSYVDSAISASATSIQNTADADYVPVSDLGQLNGVATLNSSGKVPASQLDITELAQDAVDSALAAGTGVIKAYNDASNVITISTDTSVIATKLYAETYADQKVADLVASAPAALNTLNELSAALGNDANYAATITNALALKSPAASPTFTGTVVLPQSTSIGGADATSLSYVGGLTSNAQAQFGAVQASLATKAPIDSPVFTTAVGLPAQTTIGSISPTEIGYLDGISSNVQQQIDAKSPLASPVFTGSVTLPATTAIGEVSNVEIAYLNNVTSNVQTQLDAKAPLASPVFTGTVGGITKGMVGLSNVDDTTDALKPISTATQAALDLKAAAADLTSHAADTTAIHGIADTAELATKAYADSAVSTHTLDTTAVHGIADTSLLATTANVATAKSEAITAAGTAADTKVSTAVAALTKSSVGLANVDNTSDANKPVSTATQAALDLKSPLASPTFTGTVTTGHVLPATDITFDLGSPTKMWRDIYVGPGSLYVNGQKVLQTDAGDVVITADANENLALRTSGSGNIELDPTGAGTVNIKGPLVVEAGANFSSADGNGIAFSNGIKSDSVSSKTLNTDLSLSGNGTGKVYLNDNAEVNGNLVVSGNLTVSGTTTTVNSETISLADNLIDLNSNFTTGAPTENAGIKIKRGDSSDVQLRWNESSDKWEFTTDGTNYSVIAPTDSPTFTGTVTLPANTISQVHLTDDSVGTNEIGGLAVTEGKIAAGAITDAKVSATAAIAQSKISGLTSDLSAKAPLASPTFTGTVTVAAAGVAFTDGTQTKAGVPSLTTIGTEISADYNLSTGGLALRDQLIPIAGTRRITVPLNATTAFPIGTSIDFYQASGTGANFFPVDAGVTILRTPGLTLRTLYSSATLTKVAINTWLLAGDLTA
jgi:hypothetical protein